MILTWLEKWAMLQVIGFCIGIGFFVLFIVVVVLLGILKHIEKRRYTKRMKKEKEK